MSHYIDGFVLPVPRESLAIYQQAVAKVAEIWKEYGALEYSETVADDLSLEGVASFVEAAKAQQDEVIIFGWVRFASRQARDEANKKVAADPRMAQLIEPLIEGAKPIFNAKRMLYAGFRPLL